MKKVDSQDWPQQPKKEDKEYKQDLIFICMLIGLLLLGVVIGLSISYCYIQIQKHYQPQQHVETRYVHDTVCVKDTIQVQYLEGQLSLQQNKVIRLEKQLEHCENDKNYHVIEYEKP